MERDTHRKLSLATVTDKRFVSGTEVMLDSFLRLNNWFDGSIFIIHAGLSPRTRRRLAAFPNVTYHQVGGALQSRLDLLCAAHPHLTAKVARFYSLEAFNLPTEDRVVYLDGDILCNADVGGLLEAEGPLLACPDLAHYRHGDGSGPPSEVRTGATFNTGMMVLDSRVLSASQAYTRLCRGLVADRWATVRTGHTDQVILNDVFRDEWKRLPWRYNRLVTPGAVQAPPLGAIEEAAFIHFLGRPKPWESYPAGLWGQDGPSGVDRRKAVKLWRRAARGRALRTLGRGNPVPLVRLTVRPIMEAARRLVG